MILVVDDTLASRYITSSWLQRSGHQVIEASTGAEALRTLATRAVDLVILDVGLPDMSGFEVCERIKADPGPPRPVIHLSATSVRGADRAQGLTRGADAYLVEPVEPDELLATVASVLRYYRAREVAERFADQLSRLTAATLAMQKATAFDELTAAIAAGTAAVFGVPATTLLVAPQGSVQRAVAGGGASAPVVDSVAPRVLAEIATRAGARRTMPFPLPARVLSGTVTGDAPDWTAVLLASRGTRAPGIVAVQEPLARPEQIGLLAQIGQAAMLAFDSLRLYTEEHNLALTLQRSFLPSMLPERRGLEVAARYVPAADNAEIGGDFYELIELNDGRLPDRRRRRRRALDPRGHRDGRAAARPARLRPRRALAVGHPRLPRTHAAPVPSHRVRDPVRAAPRPGAQRADHRQRRAPLPAGPGERQRPTSRSQARCWSCGARTRRMWSIELAPSWSLVLITDGLVEDPRVDLDVALEDLRTTVMDELDPDRLCERLLERLGRPRFDDIALLVLRGTACSRRVFHSICTTVPSADALTSARSGRLWIIIRPRPRKPGSAGGGRHPP